MRDNAARKHGCLLLFTGREYLLIPIPIIKEIVPSKEFSNIQDGFGKIVWRDDILPVFYFPQLFETQAEKDGVIPTHMVIFTGLSTHVESYGVLTTGIPRSVWLTEEDILSQEEGSGAVKWYVKIEGYNCIIPDLDYLENRVLTSNTKYSR